MGKGPRAGALGAGDPQDPPVLLLAQVFQGVCKLFTPRQGGWDIPELKRQWQKAEGTWVAAGKGGFTPCTQQMMGEHHSPASPPRLCYPPKGCAQRQSNIPCNEGNSLIRAASPPRHT